MQKLLLSVLLLITSTTQTTQQPQNTFLSIAVPVSVIAASGAALWFACKIPTPSEDSSNINSSADDDKNKTVIEQQKQPVKPFYFDLNVISKIKNGYNPWVTENQETRELEELCLEILENKQITINCDACKYDKILDNQDIIIISCDHITCGDCYKKMLTENYNCSLCKDSCNQSINFQSALSFASFWLDQIHFNKNHLKEAPLEEQQTNFYAANIAMLEEIRSDLSSSSSSQEEPSSSTKKSQWSYYKEQALIGLKSGLLN